MDTTLKTFDAMNRSGGIDSYDNYMGDTSIGNMLVFLSHGRDSDILTESNFQVALERLGGKSKTVQVHRFGHWACGWFELILINPNDDNAIEQAEDILNALSDYPVLDDEDYSQREWDKVIDYWDHASARERLDYIKDLGLPLAAAAHSNSPMIYDRLYENLTMQ